MTFIHYNTKLKISNVNNSDKIVNINWPYPIWKIIICCTNFPIHILQQKV